jgi:rubrerythrin
MVPLKRLRTFFNRGATDSLPEKSPAPRSSLYECPLCGTVYISEEMQACPDCDGTVDQVPNERELGLGQ